MTTPAGDLPDWQTIVNPPILSAAIQDQPGGAEAGILTMTKPFRIWGAWVSYRYSSNTAYVAGLGSSQVLIKDVNGNIILTISGELRVASQSISGQLAIAVPGLTPAMNGGLWVATLHTDATAANTDYRASGGIYYSVP